MKYLTFIYIILIIAYYTNFVKTKFIYSCTEPKTIALTFDDGPYKYTKDLVDYIIEIPDVKITFFNVAIFHYPYAINVQEYQDAMKKAHDHGFQIASHTYSHKIPEATEEFRKSLVDMDDFIENVTGDRPRYFRAPKGHCDEQCQANLDEWGYRLIQWDTDTNDWDLETSGSVKQRVKDSINFLKKKFSEEKESYLILMHDTQNYTVSEIVPWIIEESGMKEKGYRFVTVAECLGDNDAMYTSEKIYIDDISSNDASSTIIFSNDTIIDGDSNIYIEKGHNNNNNDNNNNNNNNSTNDINIDKKKNMPLVFTDNPGSQNLDSSSIITAKPTNFFIYIIICLFLISMILLY